MVGCSSDLSDRPPMPDTDSCNDWEWDENLGVWECDDDDSNYRGHYFYGGSFYKGSKKLKASSSYKSYKSSYKSGFGSGSKGGFGG
ncbi:hypothetical protein [Fredinandcohnia quinoae]|uniref:Uncharacterized protein n=1 Tax=Fredinandcohnia quinoae TaxID=2918902 RepID=A0AAW5E5A9_9BACI|nr:hypothetical protein [Fredinandcohnia sp. SECRCQ15]MCH1624288.1 hypothetical protein [Fredinandcohnia sp. SECRCQ15]